MLLVTHYFSTHRGGVELIAAALAQQLVVAKGWTIIWMASDADRNPENLPATVQTLPATSWNGLERRFGVPWPVWSPWSLVLLWREVGRADVIHLHDALYFGNAFALLFARLRGVPVVVTQHIGAVPYRSGILRKAHDLANRSIGRWVLSGSDQVVFYSNAVHDYFSEFCRFRRAPSYVANGVDTSVFSFAEGDVRPKRRVELGIAGVGRVFLFVGRFVEKKGLDILRSLAGGFPEDTWIFAGRGPLDPEAWSLPNVRVVRGETGKGLARYYQAADLLVLPSKGEGFPLVVQEALACGTPVLVGEDTAGACPEARPLMFVEAVGAADTIDRWFARIARLRAGELDRWARRAEAAEYAVRHWSWVAAAGAYAEIIAGLAAEGAQGRQ